MNVRISILLALLLTTLTGTAQAGDLVAGKYVKVFKGDEGLQVTVLHLEPASGNQALIQVSGVSTAIDGLVLLHEVDDNKSEIAYRTQVAGRGFTTLLAQKRYWGGKSFNLRFPEDVRETVVVWYDEKASKKASAKKLLAAHKKQTKDGTIARLQAFDRSGDEAEAIAGLAEVVGEVKEACGAQVAVTIDWSTVSDTQLKRLSLSSLCGNPLTALRKVCEDSEEARAVVPQRIKALQCSLGEKLRLRLDEAGTLSWTIDPAAANQVDFAKAYLLNEL